MNDEYFEFQLETRRIKARSKVNTGRFGTLRPGFDPSLTGFKCGHCRVYISAELLLSGVNNRNHCPYCLWSKHLDLYQAGDRLAACKSLMRPVGLALKCTRKKYGTQAAGELMLVHLCIDCGKVSLNRFAADDDVDKVWGIFASPSGQAGQILTLVQESGVNPLDLTASDLVRAQLFGRRWDLVIQGKAVALNDECESQNNQ
jgi:hypothetical protein